MIQYCAHNIINFLKTRNVYVLNYCFSIIRIPLQLSSVNILDDSMQFRSNSIVLGACCMRVHCSLTRLWCLCVEYRVCVRIRTALCSKRCRLRKDVWDKSNLRAFPSRYGRDVSTAGSQRSIRLFPFSLGCWSGAKHDVAFGCVGFESKKRPLDGSHRRRAAKQLNINLTGKGQRSTVSLSLRQRCRLLVYMCRY